ncbi:MAG: CHASE3 domain-containing protein, partial [Longimicrobiales bacterium]
MSRWRRTAAAVGPVILVGLLGALTLVGQKRERFRADWVAHTQRVLLLLERTHADLLGAESGQRGFVLLGDSAYLRPFVSAGNSVHPRLDSLRWLTADNPPQVER